MNLIGDVQGKVAVMVDDMIDTAGMLERVLLELSFFSICFHLELVPGCASESYFYALIFDTAGTIANSAALLHQEGAREVYACCTHAVFRYI
jgi:phosphoribosylpyrophosphate synthetase